MDHKRMPWKDIAIAFFEAVFFVNLIILDVILIKNVSTNMQPKAATEQKKIVTVPTPTIASPLAVSPTIALTPPTTLPTPQVTQAVYNGVTEFFVPFGPGSSTASTWTDVPGLQAYINSASYPNIQQVVFEASIFIPTGNQWASARLYDKTQQHPVWNSEVTVSGGAPLLMVSQPITLDPGTSLYQVQMQTQLQAPAQLNQSRVHIYLQ